MNEPVVNNMYIYIYIYYICVYVFVFTFSFYSLEFSLERLVEPEDEPKTLRLLLPDPKNGYDMIALDISLNSSVISFFVLYVQ